MTVSQQQILALLHTDEIDFKDVIEKSTEFLDSHCVWMLAHQLLQERRMPALESLFVAVCDSASNRTGPPIETHHVCSMILNYLSDFPQHVEVMERM
jgi:hypothetical protein